MRVRVADARLDVGGYSYINLDEADRICWVINLERKTLKI